MVYECPSFSFALLERSMLKVAANELAKLRNSILAEEYFKAWKTSTDYKEINNLLMKALSELGENCNNFM